MADDEIEANAAADKVKNAFMIFSILRLIETKFSAQVLAEIWRWRWRSCAPSGCTLADEPVGNQDLDDWLGSGVSGWRNHSGGAAQVAVQIAIIACCLWAAISIAVFSRLATFHHVISRPCRRRPGGRERKQRDE